jgi:Protein of unknown function (DUF1553)/Protein of unknown function (DUF1549)
VNYADQENVWVTAGLPATPENFILRFLGTRDISGELSWVKTHDEIISSRSNARKPGRPHRFPEKPMAPNGPDPVVKASSRAFRPRPIRTCLLIWTLTLGAIAGTPPKDHWSFLPPKLQTLPTPKNPHWIRNPVDAFILDRLERSGLDPNPEASRRIWIRRVHLDLIGLPPSPEEVRRFEADSRPDAHERVVESLLASPRHGERWGQQWLDVVRYADTHGFEVNTERPHAWPYRDHVIRSFNKDTPYNRFVEEQIVGDRIGADAATGFLITASVLLPGQIGADDVSKRLARQDALDEIVVNVGQTFLGLSVGCARCHDHKSDPITSRDYYALQAFVAGVEYEDREIQGPIQEESIRLERERKARIARIDLELGGLVPVARPTADRAQPAGKPSRPAINTRVNIDRFPPVTTRRLRFTIQGTSNLEPCIDELEVFDSRGTNIALASSGTRVASSGDTRVVDRHDLAFLNDGRPGNSSSWMSNEHGRGWVILEFPGDRTFDRVVWGRDRTGEFSDRIATNYMIEVEEAQGGWRRVADATDREPGTTSDARPPLSIKDSTPDVSRIATPLLAERQEIEKLIRNSTNERLVFAGRFRTPDSIRVLHRGDPEQPKDEVSPTPLPALGRFEIPRISGEQDRRQALADWITSPSNPLTARVLVNRIWQGHFGVGLVDTASDFGVNGSRPTHPELLDWLASEFLESGGSMKHLHRLIVLSSTYRQHAGIQRPATGGSPAAGVDADARLLWRFPSRRLDSEPIRDSMLAVSGELDLRMHGRGFDLFNNRGGLTGFTPVESFNGEGLRRMIYAHKVRREREAVFGAFDCPDAGQSTARRRESMTPIQALNLFNSRFTLERAEAFAGRVTREVGTDPAAQIQRAYGLALGREATADEVAEALTMVRDHGVSGLCRVLFNSNEFLFLP